MALVVENGTGVAGANSYVSNTDYQNHHNLVSSVAFANTAQEVDGAGFKAFGYLNSLRWKGLPVFGRQFAAAWPRRDVKDQYGQSVDSTTIPNEVIQAQLILMFSILNDENDPHMTHNPLEPVVREKIDIIDIQYAIPNMETGVMPVLPAVDNLLAGLVKQPAVLAAFTA